MMALKRQAVTLFLCGFGGDVSFLACSSFKLDWRPDLPWSDPIDPKGLERAVAV